MTTETGRNFTQDIDLLPEYCRYQDEGCEYAASCLRCPFERCIDEEPGGRLHWLRVQRDREIVRLFTAEKKTVGELARHFEVSARTVQRALKNPDCYAKEER
jgi:hypothetical protein